MPRALVLLLAATGILLLGCTNTASEQTATPMRTVQDAAGQHVKVPAASSRIVTTHYAATQTALDLGLTPIGQGEYDPTMVRQDRLGAISEIPVVASGEDIDIQQVAQLTPELILTPDTTDPAQLRELRRIAPTFQFPLDGGVGWRDRVDQIAEALNLTSKALQLRADLEHEQRLLTTTYATVIENRSVGVYSSKAPNEVYVWGEHSQPGELLTSIGFTWSHGANEAVSGNQRGASIGIDELTDIFADADVLFVETDLTRGKTPLVERIEASAEYSILPAVESGQVFEFGKADIAGYGDAFYSLRRVREALIWLEA